jgi:hypothetical protein
MIVNVYKAQQTLRAEKIPYLTIQACDPIPDLKNGQTLQDAELIYDRDAQQIVDALFACLPQGTTDRIAMKMFGKKLSLFVGREGDFAARR